MIIGTVQDKQILYLLMMESKSTSSVQSKLNSGTPIKINQNYLSSTFQYYPTF